MTPSSKNLCRRSILASVAAYVAWPRGAGAEETKLQRPLVGAIRWDAWYSPGSTATSAVRNSLAPAKYRWRLPFFAEVPSGGEPTIPTISQAEMDLEIRQAMYAGLDYWAFVAYGNEDPMSAALSKYLTSRESPRLKFCMFTELNRWGSLNQPTQMIADHIALMDRDEYVRVLNGRPLYYLGFIDRKSVNDRWGGDQGLRGAIDEFRKRCITRLGKNPYVVLAGTSTEIEYWSALGGDAVSAYTISDPRGSGDYEALRRLVEQRWQAMTAFGRPVIPTVVTGWDRRPRIEHPMPWEHSQVQGAGMDHYFGAPTPPQIAEHLRQAIQFVSRQPSGRRAPAILIYAWNENDEGGWLLPTIPCNTERLQALHGVLAPAGTDLNPECRTDR